VDKIKKITKIGWRANF